MSFGARFVHGAIFKERNFNVIDGGSIAADLDRDVFGLPIAEEEADDTEAVVVG